MIVEATVADGSVEEFARLPMASRMERRPKLDPALAAAKQNSFTGFTASFPTYDETAISARPVLAWNSPIASLSRPSR